MKITITFLKGLQPLYKLEGKDIPEDYLTSAEWRQLFDTEALLEKATGFRVHVNHET